MSAILDLACEHDLRAEDIEQIEVLTLKRAAEILADPSKYDIQTRETADHSLPYCVAAAVVDRELTPRQFQRGKLKSPSIQRLVRRVSVKAEPAFEARFPLDQPCRVVIRLGDGSVLEKQRAYPRGDPRDPLSTEEMRRKFSSLAELVIGSEQQEVVLGQINQLERVEDMAILMKGLAIARTEERGTLS